MNEIELTKKIHAHLLSRAEWWRTNPDDTHNINTAVYVALFETANAIKDALSPELPPKSNKHYESQY